MTQSGQPEDNLTLSEVTEHLRFLSSDDLMGRKTGTAGNDTAARYIAKHFRDLGLASLATAANYLQRVPLEKVNPSAEGTIQLAYGVLKQGDDMLIIEGTREPIEARTVFVEYGRSQPIYDENEYTESAKGKIVVARFGLPGVTGQSALLATRKKGKIAKTKCAVALIELYSGQIPWAALSRFLLSSRIQISDAEDDRISHILIHDPQGKYLEMFRNASQSVTINADGFVRQSLTSNNVVGMVSGIDPTLKNEYLIVSAHFDHVGAGLHLPGATQADSIFNGARDNAMGTVAVMSAAKALAQNPPARSVIFVATTAEEEGLLGSRYYVEKPLVPLRRTVFVLNSDGGGMTDPEVVTVMGLERTNVEPLIKGATEVYGLETIPDPVPQMGLFNRSDNAPFARAGVPAITFSPGFRAFDDKMTSKLHQPGDEADDEFSFDYLLKFCQAFTHTARKIADMPTTPRWHPGDEFEKVADRLYEDR